VYASFSGLKKLLDYDSSFLLSVAGEEEGGGLKR
jgi:hypothetical protein